MTRIPIEDNQADWIRHVNMENEFTDTNTDSDGDNDGGGGDRSENLGTDDTVDTE